MIKTKNKSFDMTVGSPIKILLMFAVPIFLGQLFQQFYNVVDTKIVGEKLGDTKIAAMGSVGTVYYLLNSIANGLNNGCAIVVARMFGAKDADGLKKTIAHMFCIDLISSALFMTAGLLFIDLIMRAMEVTEQIYDDARIYLLITLCGMVTAMMYNMFAAILRATGDSRTPLYFLIGSSIVNVLLDLALVPSFGVGGAAAATVFSQALSAIMCFLFIIRNKPEFRLRRQDFRLDKKLLGELLSLGLSMGIISSLVAFGGTAMSRAANILSSKEGFGEDVITARTAGGRVDGFIMMPLSTMGTALATFVGQNRGAGRPDRIRKAVKDAFLAGAAWITLGIGVIYIFGGSLVKWLTGSDKETVEKFAKTYMRINVPCFYMLMVLVSLRSVLQGFGKKIIPIVTAVAELVLKFFAAEVLTPELDFIGICIAEPIIWTVGAVIVAVVYFRTVVRPMKDKEQNIQKIKI